MIHSITQSTNHSVRLICQARDVPRSSYYHAAEPTESQLSDADMATAIATLFWQHRRRYGYRNNSPRRASFAPRPACAASCASTA